MTNEIIRELCRGYLAGTLNPAELQQFLTYLRGEDGDELLKEEMLAALQEKEYPFLAGEEKTDEVLRQVLDKIREQRYPLLEVDNETVSRRRLPEEKKVSRLPARTWWAAAAVVLLLAGSAGVLFRSRGPKPVNITAKTITREIVPGTDKAVLTLSNGSQIFLDSGRTGMIAEQGNWKILKTSGSRISYHTAGDDGRGGSGTGGVGSNGDDGMQGAVGFNTLSTPRGGQYQVELPDGTVVWLNAASSLRYPVFFTGKDRRVQLEGEAYFEVAKNTVKPFIVEKDQTEVQVLGTQFNMNAYDDEATTSITLITGSVNITQLNSHKSLLIRPGQQVQVHKRGSIQLILNADLDKVLAWKDGLFRFDGDDIHEVMYKIARWYDVDVEYSGSVTRKFYGSISRNVKVGEVFKLLEMTEGVKFIVKPQEKKIIVMPYK